jgi:hypothetical protein
MPGWEANKLHPKSTKPTHDPLSSLSLWQWSCCRAHHVFHTEMYFFVFYVVSCDNSLSLPILITQAQWYRTLHYKLLKDIEKREKVVKERMNEWMNEWKWLKKEKETVERNIGNERKKW